jgi:DNA-directed RNA polymerase specialized sigma24 family protein
MSSTALASREPRVAQRCQGRVAHLVLRCGQGDEAALGDLFDLTYFLVAAVVNPGGGSSAGADQAVVEAFWRIWDHSPAYVPAEASVLAWLLDQAQVA